MIKKIADTNFKQWLLLELREDYGLNWLDDKPLCQAPMVVCSHIIFVQVKDTWQSKVIHKQNFP